MSQHATTTAVLSVALVAAVWGGFLLGKRRQPPPPAPAVASESDFARKLLAADADGWYVQRESDRPCQDGLVVSDHPLTPEEAHSLYKDVSRRSQWRGVFWVRRMHEGREKWQDSIERWGDMAFVQGDLLFFGDQDAAARACLLAGL